MLGVTIHEFRKQIKSIKSILVILIIISITIGVASVAGKYKSLIEMAGGSNVYTLGLTMTILIAGPLFTLSLSHNIINEEIRTRTIRFIATKTSRTNIVIGKYLGIVLFWLVCLVLSMLLISLFSHSIYINKIMISFAFILYFIGLTVLLSTLISNPIMTNLLGITLSIVMTILGLWGTLSNNIFLKIFSYVTPYHYFIHEQNTILAYIPILFSLLFVILSVILFRKRDL
jgi:ABC-2 type transport system permease protein